METERPWLLNLVTLRWALSSPRPIAGVGLLTLLQHLHPFLQPRGDRVARSFQTSAVMHCQGEEVRLDPESGKAHPRGDWTFVVSPGFDLPWYPMVLLSLVIYIYIVLPFESWWRSFDGCFSSICSELCSFNILQELTFQQFVAQFVSVFVSRRK